jgi:hypothetical protein
MRRMWEQVFAALGVVVCAALLVHMLLPARRRQRVDAALWRGWQGLRGGVQRGLQRRQRVTPTLKRSSNSQRPVQLHPLKPSKTVQRPPVALDDAPSDDVRRQAEAEAQDAIDRARRQARGGSVQRDGNVYRPDAFKPGGGPPGPQDTLH